MEIVLAKKKHLREVGELLIGEFSSSPFNEKVGIDSVIKSLEFYFKIGGGYVAIEGGEILGVLIFKVEQYWEGKVIIIEDLAVKKKGRGVGSELMSVMEKNARSDGAVAIHFSTSKKCPAAKFYKKHGYKIRKDRLEMSKKLDGRLENAFVISDGKVVRTAE